LDIKPLPVQSTGHPRRVFKAAAIGGAGGWRKLGHVTIPLVSPAIFLMGLTVFIFRGIGRLVYYEEAG
jgi:ABC-type sugar transport system permease subunit